MNLLPENPKGIPSQSPGLRGTSYPGNGGPAQSNPNGVALPIERRTAFLMNQVHDPNTCSKETGSAPVRQKRPRAHSSLF